MLMSSLSPNIAVQNEFYADKYCARYRLQYERWGTIYHLLEALTWTSRDWQRKRFGLNSENLFFLFRVVLFNPQKRQNSLLHPIRSQSSLFKSINNFDDKKRLRQRTSHFGANAKLWQCIDCLCNLILGWPQHDWMSDIEYCRWEW